MRPPALRKLLGYVRTTVIVEIHRQKSDITSNVDVTKPIVKLDTIVNRERLRCHMNVLQMGVPVTIADPFLPNAGGK
jgi:hypothetical protein